MHHHLFPESDTYVTNESGFEDKNFGINEILRIGTSTSPMRVLEDTKDYPYSNVIWTNHCITNFTGILTGSFSGAAESVYGTIIASASFSSSYFNGYFDGVLVESSGGFSGSVDGIVSGSLTASVFPNFDGQLTSSYGKITGTVTGIDTRNENHWVTTATKLVDRTIIKFDLNTISASVANGEITNPEFKLNLKVCNEYELPISYAIYAFPVSQSWVMGNGYFSDGGSYTGASWYYRDYVAGTAWYAPITTSLRPVVDFFNTESNATASFAYGGGTWYYDSASKQDFSYESADISMDVTDIVMTWINGTLPNNGFILMSSDEIVASGSGFALTFYSKDTNSINSPYLDVMWSDWIGESGSVDISSANIITPYPGLSGEVQNGSSLSGNSILSGGSTNASQLSGSFSGSSLVNFTLNYITASNAPVNNLCVFQFTGSLTGSFLGTASYALGIISGGIVDFYTDYFTGNIDGTPSTITSGKVLSNSSVLGSITGSVITSTYLGDFSGSITSSNLYISGGVSGTYLDTIFHNFNGFFACNGFTGNISGVPVIGNVQGLITIDPASVYTPTDMTTLYPSMPYNQSPYSTGYQNLYSDSPYNGLINVWYTWMGDTWTSNMPAYPTYPITTSCGNIPHQAQTMMGTLTSGVFSGSHFVAYYSNYSILIGSLQGFYTTEALLNSTVTIPLPSGIDPYAYAYFTGTYVNGTAMGLYNLYPNSHDSSSFTGQFINGELLGSYVTIQLSGSMYTSSYSYTGSVNYTSNTFKQLDTNSPFTVIVKNLKPTIKSGDLIQVNVFGRQEFP